MFSGGGVRRCQPGVAGAGQMQAAVKERFEALLANEDDQALRQAFPQLTRDIAYRAFAAADKLCDHPMVLAIG